MEKLIFLTIVFVLYLLFGWWKSRQQQEEESTDPWPGQGQRPGQPGPRPGAPPARPTGPSPAASWEEDLRRLLQGEPLQPPPPAQPAPPPLRPAQPTQRPPVSPPVQRPAAAARRAPATPPSVPVGGEDPDMQKGLPVHMPTLKASAQAYLRASQLESRITERFQRVQDRVTTHQSTEVKKEPAPEIHQALGLLRDRSSQRAAIVAAVVLGPPRALEV